LIVEHTWGGPPAALAGLTERDGFLRQWGSVEIGLSALKGRTTGRFRDVAVKNTTIAEWLANVTAGDDLYYLNERSVGPGTPIKMQVDLLESSVADLVYEEYDSIWGESCTISCVLHLHHNSKS
jgi:hypothetical protein